jgi:hypothetical protein
LFELSLASPHAPEFKYSRSTGEAKTYPQTPKS